MKRRARLVLYAVGAIASALFGAAVATDVPCPICGCGHDVDSFCD